MLNIANTPSEAQTVRIPLVYYPSRQADLVLVLRSGIDNAVRASVTLGEPVIGRAYAGGTLLVPEGLADGEYTYCLKCGSDTLGAGLVTLGDYRREVKEQKTTIQFTQYAN